MRRRERFTIPGKYILFVLTVLCVGTMSLSFLTDFDGGLLNTISGYVLIPIQRGINTTGGWMRSRVENLEDLTAVKGENEQLREQIADLTLENNSLLQERYELEELEQEVFTDSKWVIFILGQLLQNAIRYRGENPVVSFSAKKFGKQIHLTVSDNGIGIPEYELPRVFDRGFTGSNGRSRGGSTGMGLYLCKKLADCLEIGIRITAKEGRGTAVTLSFYHA